MKNILKVRMLGGFTLEYKGKELVLDRNNVSKTTQLFQLLLLHTQDGGISKAALIDALYGRSDVENKNGSLNNTIFRLRKQLTAAGLPESSYININGGMCTWDPDIETSVDVCDFKQTIESARHEKSQKTKMEIYAKAWKLYTGEFLPDMMGEDWAAVENIACREQWSDLDGGTEQMEKGKKKHTGTFVVHVSHCDNATWQGEVTWAEANKKKSFRSALELIRLIDGALEVDE